MTAAFSRTDTSTVGRWWWTIDRWLLITISCLFLIGIVLILAAGPPAADRIGASTYYFVRKQSFFIPLSVAVMLAISIVSPKWIRRIAIIGLLISISTMLLTLIVGTEVNGARRWLRFASISIQPSEFVKPFFVVASAWMFTLHKTNNGFPGNMIAFGFLLMVCSLLLSQPDVGMTLVVVCVWCAQLFIAGLSILWVMIITVIGFTALLAAYFLFPHVTSRVNRFLDPSSGDTYQVDQSILAFKNGADQEKEE
jgi:cell division protein FtsW